MIVKIEELNGCKNIFIGRTFLNPLYFFAKVLQGSVLIVTSFSIVSPFSHVRLWNNAQVGWESMHSSGPCMARKTHNL